MPEPSSAAGSATASNAPRSLAEALRARDDASLAALLHARPDLLGPVPGDMTQLATRAGTRASVVRALDRLDRFALQTAEALAVAPDPCPYPVLESLLAGEQGSTGEDNGARAELPRALATLRDQALVWGDDERLRLVRTARELLAPSAGRPSPRASARPSPRPPPGCRRPGSRRSWRPPGCPPRTTRCPP